MGEILEFAAQESDDHDFNLLKRGLCGNSRERLVTIDAFARCWPGSTLPTARTLGDMETGAGVE